MSFRSVIGLIGLPRSGTTLIANSVFNHPKVIGIHEPYHSRRANNFRDTSVETFAASLGLAPDLGKSLAVKETTTRQENVDLLFKLLEDGQQRGLYCGLVLILRCPFECYLSQVDASRNLWKQKKLIEISQESFLWFARSSLLGLQTVMANICRQHYRLVSYGDFCRDPANQLARIMGIIPEHIVPKQLSFTASESRVGDPLTREKAGRVERTDRSAGVAELERLASGLDEFAIFRELSQIAEKGAANMTDEAIVSRITSLALYAR